VDGPSFKKTHDFNGEIQMHFPKLMFSLGRLALFLGVMAVVSAAGPARAQSGDLFDALAAQPVTLLDAGIKRVRAGAQSAARRLTPANGPPAQFRVTFDRDLRRLDIRFTVVTTPDKANESYCWSRRAIAIREAFSIGTVRYTLSLSDEERVRRRLGVMFSREPEATDREIVALGQRLADLTFAEVSLLSPASEAPVICRAVVHRLDWQ
jgi:hypothetical protein